MARVEQRVCRQRAVRSEPLCAPDPEQRARAAFAHRNARRARRGRVWLSAQSSPGGTPRGARRQ